MTDILRNLTNEAGSDNEDIKKLFPKCKLKSVSSSNDHHHHHHQLLNNHHHSDINLNKIHQDYDCDITNNISTEANNKTCLIDVYRDANKNDQIESVVGGGGTGGRRRHNCDVVDGFVVVNNNDILSPNHNNERRSFKELHTINSISRSSSSSGHSSSISSVGQGSGGGGGSGGSSSSHVGRRTSGSNLDNNIRETTCRNDVGTDNNLILYNDNGGNSLLEDHSVVSAYDRCSNALDGVGGHSKLNELSGGGGGGGMMKPSVEKQQQVFVDEEVVYDDSLDVGYRVPVMREEFKLRESRIEIAGGREVFSTSRSRPAKKRFSDDILYNRPSDKELKRQTSEATSSDGATNNQGRYHHHHHHPRQQSAMRRSSVEDVSHCSSPNVVASSSNHAVGSGGCAPNCNRLNKTRNHSQSKKIVCNVDELQRVRNGRGGKGAPVNWDSSHVSTSGDLVDGGTTRDVAVVRQLSSDEGPSEVQKETFVLKGQRSGMFIYETVVCGTSEVVYDDIGEWSENGVVDSIKFYRNSREDCSFDNIGANHQLGSGGGGGDDVRLDHFHKQLTTSTEAVNSEDFLSEREDGMSPQEDVSSPVSRKDKKKINNISVSTVVSGLMTSKRDLVYCGETLSRDLCSVSSSDDVGTESGQSSPGRESASVANLIGSLPIAQYEGSPRRYGPRPGHPQRIMAMSEMSESDQVLAVAPTALSTNKNTVCGNLDLQSKECESGTVRSNKSGESNGGFISNFGETVYKNDDVGSSSSKSGVLPSFSNYDYQYEESETRKVLEEFYHQDGLYDRIKESGTLSAEAFNELEYRLYRLNTGNSYVGRRLAHSNVLEAEDSPKKRPVEKMLHLRDQLLAGSISSVDGGNRMRVPTTTLSKENVFNFNLERDRLRDQVTTATTATTLLRDHDGETVSTNEDTEDLAETEVGEQVGQSRNFTLSPETTECDSNDVESEVSMENDGSIHSSSRQYSSMPVLEDGLSSGHSSDGEVEANDDVEEEEEEEEEDEEEELEEEEDDDGTSDQDQRSCDNSLTTLMMKKQISEIEKEIARRTHHKQHKHELTHLQHHFQQPHVQPSPVDYREVEEFLRRCDVTTAAGGAVPVTSHTVDLDLDMLDPLRETASATSPPPPAPHPHRPSPPALDANLTCESVSEAINEIKQAIRKTKSIMLKSPPMEKPEGEDDAPVWVLRPSYKHKSNKDDDGRTKREGHEEDECDTDQETDRLLGEQRSEDHGFLEDKRLNDALSSLPSTPLLKASPVVSDAPSKENEGQKKKGRTKEVLIHEPAVLIEGVLFRARYLGSTQLVCEGQPTKATRMMQAEEAVSTIKAPEGETQPSTEVDLFISTEKIMVLNTDLKEIMMDHALRTISYIADIGDLVVLMARRRVMSTADDPEPKLRRTPKMICHVFESDEAQFIAQSIGQAFQVAYMEFLKANGIEDHSFVKEMDYQEVLNSQEIYGDELEMFAKKEMQKEVIVPKLKGEILGVVIVESGWGSMLPTVVIANLSPNGAAARCGQLNIGDQIIAINGISLVGLPLSTCQNYIKSAKNQTVVKLTVVPCAPVVEVKIKRPDTKYQLGFSVQNGVICSLLRGGIAERGGVRVGHRIIEINGQSVVAVPHERIVNLLATSVGEIHMKTMPTSMFRLLTGQESPIFI